MLTFFVSGSSVSADTSRDKLIPAGAHSFSIEGYPNVFVREEADGLFVYKHLVPQSLASDTRLVDYVLTASGSRLIRNNPILSIATIPNDHLPLGDIPDWTIRTHRDYFDAGRARFTRAKFIDGRLPPALLSEVPANEARRAREESRIFHAEAVRTVNWVRSHGSKFRGRPLRAVVDVDIVEFWPEHRAERQDSLLRMAFHFETDACAFGLSFGQNIVITDNTFVKIDPW